MEGDTRKISKKNKSSPENTTSDVSDLKEGKPLTDDASSFVNANLLQSDTTTSKKMFHVNFEVDLMALFLFFIGLCTRFYKLQEPRNIVFDELHYGRYISLYIKGIFFFDSHPPLGKQLLSAAAHFAGYSGNFTFDKIGSPYNDIVPIFALRMVPALCGSLLVPLAYKIMLALKTSGWTATLAAILVICDNALLTQSRFMLMESILLTFGLFGLLCLLKFKRSYGYSRGSFWWLWLVFGCISLTCSLSVKYSGFYSCCLGIFLVGQEFWNLLGDRTILPKTLISKFLRMGIAILVIPMVVYLTIFGIHLKLLTKAGPHDSVMTSAFQASLDGGLASITKGQPIHVAHGSQITLRHTHGRTCWLHSHAHVYPIRYADKRGSSHQQQVTCYSFKDVNNWWIVKRADKNDLLVEYPVDAIKHGDVIQLVHGITSRALNSHDVAAPMSPQCQEVSCYIDYNVSMTAQNLWRVEIINREDDNALWSTIQSMIHIIHVDTGLALRFSGRQLPDWGFNQHEVVADKVINQDDTIWNVEEHRYTKTDDKKERERQLVHAEMIPTTPTSLTFWEKFVELQYKMLFASQDCVQNHMFSSEPLEWPLLSRGIAYWVSSETNAQVHLIGNLVIWYSTSVGLLAYFVFLSFYLIRRRRKCYDLTEADWRQFILIGEVCVAGFLIHYVPYFFVERTLFLHHYLPAFLYKTLLLAAIVEHIYVFLSCKTDKKIVTFLFIVLVCVWLAYVIQTFIQFSVLNYGITDLSEKDLINLRWKDTWDFILHKK